MKKSTLYIFLFFLTILVGALFFFKGYFFAKNKATLEDVLVKAEDLSKAGFNVRAQETYRADYYDVPDANGLLAVANININSIYPKDKNRVFFLLSRIFKYTNNAPSNFQDPKDAFSNLENGHLEKEFTPEFENSSYYQYRQCAIGSDQSGKQLTYACTISSVIKDHYHFTVLLNGYGKTTSEEIESILEAALKGKYIILERLP